MSVFIHFSSFSVSLDLIWQPDSLINMDSSYCDHFALSWDHEAGPDQVVLTLFTFEIFKQCDQMAVAINNARF